MPLGIFMDNRIYDLTDDIAELLDSLCVIVLVLLYWNNYSGRYNMIDGNKIHPQNRDKHINGLFLGSHQPIFHSIEKELPVMLKEKLRGEFITELNLPVDKLIKHCKDILIAYSK